MWQDLKYYRMALGINMLWNSYPVIFILRDGFHIGPGGSTFTILFWGLGLALLIPVNIFQTIYFPNKILFACFISFWVLSLIYWQYYVAPYSYPERLRETLTYVIPLLFLFGAMYFPNDKVRIILVVMVFYSLLASTGLLYSLVRDPHWHFGERAAIKFNANSNNSNPHAFANNALCSLLAALILASQTKQLLIKMFYYLVVIFSVGILILTRTNTSLLSLGLMAVIYFFLNTKQVVLSLFKPRIAAIGFVLYSIVVFLLSQFRFASYALQVYLSTLISRFGKVLYTVSGVQVDKQSSEIDYSSVNRILSYQYVRDVFLGEQPWYIVLFGEGYKSQFFDLPALEAFVNQGVLGLILFNSFFLMMVVVTVQQLARPANDLSQFMAYFSIIILIMLVSGSRPIDLSMWLVYIFYIRFFGVYSFSATPLQLPLARVKT